MRKFGIEIRKIGDINNLYEDVDSVLRKADLQVGEINKDIQKQAVAHSLQKMMKPSGHLNICCIKDCINLCGIFISSERLSLYSTQHCINWTDMLPEFRMTITAMILDDFRCVLNPE